MGRPGNEATHVMDSWCCNHKIWNDVIMTSWEWWLLLSLSRAKYLHVLIGYYYLSTCLVAQAHKVLVRGHNSAYLVDSGQG